MLSTNNHWRHQAAYDRLLDWVDEFGEPHIYSSKRGGLAIWYPLDDPKLKKRLEPFDEIMIRDEAIQHHNPRSHCDFLYGSIRVYIPPEQRPLILSLSDSIHYDPLKLSLTARCHFLRANIVTLLLALYIQQGDLDIVSARQIYGPLIMGNLVSFGRINKQASNFISDYLEELEASDDYLLHVLDQVVENNQDQFFEHFATFEGDCFQEHKKTL